MRAEHPEARPEDYLHALLLSTRPIHPTKLPPCAQVRAEHPEARPEDYLQVDEHWRKFATCQLGEREAGGGAVVGGPQALLPPDCYYNRVGFMGRQPICMFAPQRIIIRRICQIPGRICQIPGRVCQIPGYTFAFHPLA